ncbi:hypothetical protein CVT24_010301 [Panaeolus cyanescens]|uniref:Endosomal/vacuolar adapter protein YPT35 n=1 Tax=Panaeolus cyanescens TaxID=181874 RepID=A0A409YQC0_9AGAR|nr:hypothetical protein CVT24_010301 [Panaeolus cyanescens]
MDTLSHSPHSQALHTYPKERRPSIGPPVTARALLRPPTSTVQISDESAERTDSVPTARRLSMTHPVVVREDRSESPVAGSSRSPTGRGAVNTSASSSTPGRTIPVHPFANSTAKLEVLISNPDKIDVEEEARLYDELCRTYENDTEDFSGNTTPASGAVISNKPNSKLVKPKPPPPIRPPPPESIFSADIFLADNTGRSHSGAFAQDVQIPGWTMVGDAITTPTGTGSKKKAINVNSRTVGTYVVYDCVIITKEGTSMHILKRYTAFEELDHALRTTVPRTLLPFIPTLPPKSALARFRPAFLDKRRKLLQFWLASVLLHPDLGGRDVVRAWVLKS